MFQPFSAEYMYRFHGDHHRTSSILHDNAVPVLAPMNIPRKIGKLNLPQARTNIRSPCKPPCTHAPVDHKGWRFKEHDKGLKTEGACTCRALYDLNSNLVVSPCAESLIVVSFKLLRKKHTNHSMAFVPPPRYILYNNIRNTINSPPLAPVFSVSNPAHWLPFIRRSLLSHGGAGGPTTLVACARHIHRPPLID